MDQKRAGTLLSYLQWIISALVGVVYTPIMLRYLGSGEYGVYSAATAVISFLTMLDLGFGQTLVRYDVKYRAEGRTRTAEICRGTLFVLYLILGALACVLGLAAAGEGARLLFGEKFTAGELDSLGRTLRILVVNLSLSFPLSVFTSLLTAQERFVAVKGANILSTLLTYGGILLALIRGGGSPALALVTTVVSLGVKGALALYALLKLGLRLRFGRPEPGMLGELFRFSFFIFINILIDQLYANTDKFILGALWGTAAITVYTVGVQFNSLFQQLSTAISGVYLPHVTKLYAQGADGKALSPLFLQVGRVQFLLLAFVLSGFIAFGQQFLLLLSGPENADAYLIALIIMVPGIVPLSQNLGISILQAMNKHRFRSLAYLALAVINVLLSIPLAARWSGIGAAIGTALACFAGQYAMMNWYYHKKAGLDIPAYWRMAGKITLRMLPMALPGYLLNLLPGTGWFSLLVRIALYTALFLPYGWRFLLQESEKAALGKIFNRFRRHP